MKGYIHSIESLAGVDGKGLRCAVFLSGCPLRCVYCHNPDTWERGGTEYSPEELVKKVRRFRPYFASSGGVTFSGGEPLLQAEFLLECALLLEKEGISFIPDTSGGVPLSSEVKSVLERSEEVLLDLKFWDDDSYRRYTGASIEPMLKMLRFLNSIGKPTTVRTVIVPGINDREDVMDCYLDVLAEFHCIKEYELLPFHTLGFHKYESLGIKNPLKDHSPCSRERKDALQKYVNEKRKANA